MKITHSLLKFLLIGTLIGLTTSAFTQDNQRQGRWQWPETNIKDLREHSTTSFDSLDVDSNGSLSIEEIDIADITDEEREKMSNTELRALRDRSNIAERVFMRWSDDWDTFEIRDINGDGVMDREEYEQRDNTLRTHMLNEGIKEFDYDRNGSVELNEFNAHLDDLDDLDKDGNGSLSREELSKIDDDQLRHSVRVTQTLAWQMQRRNSSRNWGERDSDRSTRSNRDSN